MNRRDFLALLASAPIAALAPLPRFLPAIDDGLIRTFIPEHWSDELFVTSGGNGYILDPPILKH